MLLVLLVRQIPDPPSPPPWLLPPAQEGLCRAKLVGLLLGRAIESSSLLYSAKPVVVAVVAVVAVARVATDLLLLLDSRR